LVLSETGYAAIVTALPGGPQRLANVDRIVEEFIVRERAGEDGRRVLQDLMRRSEYDADREADVATEDANAIRIMTVHQSKGLQFPIVVAADLGRRLRSNKEAVEYDRQEGAGLALAVRSPWDDWTYVDHHERVHEVRALRERAERMRLFYVQITRARDRLALVGKLEGVMKEVVEPMAEELIDRALLRRIEVPALLNSGVGRRTPREAPPLLQAQAEELGRRAARAQPAVRTLEVPVTQLEDFALCPRRFRGRHVLRLPERPEPRAAVSPEVDPDLRLDPRRRGTLAHGALERMDLGRASLDPDGALEAALLAVDAPEDADLRMKLRPFVVGPYVRRLSALPEERILRELPFTLSIPTDEASLLLRGQIDLVVEDAEGLDIVDYKVSAPKGEDPTAPYAFQLGTYAVALRREVGAEAKIRTAVQFLDGRSRLPVYTPDIHPPELGIEERLPSLAAGLLEARRTGEYGGREAHHCKKIRCGYAWLCHGSELD